MPFPASFLDELTERSDIVDVVSDYVQLKQKGSNLFGICPFHSEKTASFSVSPEKQIYHCFGCGAGGGVINFIMQAENLDFPDAVRFLASRAGMTVPEDDNGEASRRRGRLLELNREAARYFHRCLMEEPGFAAREYLKARGITEKTVKTFGLGFAPDSWDGLLKSVKGYEKSEFLDAGLVVKNNTGGVYDRFRGRVMFPIIDIRGNVIGFGGRVLDSSQPKYLNSPETSVFNKSRNLFALNLAKKTKSRQIILAEGYMDVISLHQAGFDSAVASLGTSLTDPQARLIAKYGSEAVIAYDMDEAGRTAANRAINILEKTGIAVRVLSINGAKDPDEFIKKFGADAFRLRLERSDNHIEYLLHNISVKYNLADDEQRVAYLKEASSLLASFSNPVERAVYAAKIAQAGGVAPDVVEKEAELVAKRRARSAKSRETRRILTPAANAQPKAKELRYSNIRSAKAEEGIIGILLEDDSFYPYVAQRLNEDSFSSEIFRKTFTEIGKLRSTGIKVSLALLSQSLESSEIEHLGRILIERVGETDTEKALSDYIYIVNSEAGKRQPDGDGLLKEWERLREKKRLEDKQ